MNDKNIINLLFVCVFVFLILIFRRFDAISNAQFYVEDSSIFFQQYLELGSASIFKPYAGYLHLLPRLIAFFSGTVCHDYRYMPLMYNISCLFVTMFVSLSLYLSACEMKIKHKFLYSIFYLLVPIDGGIFLNVTHIIWITPVYLINYVYCSYYNNPSNSEALSPNYIFKIIILLVFSLSGVGSMLIAPSIVLIFILERKRLSIMKIIPLAVILFGGLTQFILLRFVEVRNAAGRWLLKDVLSGGPLKIFTNNVYDVFYLYKFADLVRYRVLFIVSIIILIILILLIIKTYKKIKNKRKHVFLITGFTFFGSSLAILGSVAGLQVAGFALLHNDPVKWAHFEGYATNQRYLFIPYVCIAWIFVLGLDSVLKMWHLLVGLLFFILHYKELRNDFPDLHWKEQVSEYYEGKRDTIYTNPNNQSVWGWRVVFPRRINKK